MDWKFFQSEREFATNPRWILVSHVPQGVAFEREEIFPTTNGTKSFVKRATLATANDTVDGWKGGDDATFPAA